jgi:uncharacterized protein YodC (DUF2158 family)
MPNLRIIHDNAADRATLTASTEAGSKLGVANLKKDKKSQVWRATAKTATLTVVWPTQEIVGGVALPFTNLTSTATIRVRGYINPTDLTPAFDTGNQAACPYAPLGLFSWGTQPMGVNAYAFGGGAYACTWFDHIGVRKLVIDIADAANLNPYVEASRLVVGSYWSPALNADWGAAIDLIDTSKSERSDAGELLTDLGTRAKKISINQKQLDPLDRARLWDIILTNGMVTPILFSLHPEDIDPTLEQTYQVYGKMVQKTRFTHQYHQTYGAPIEIEEV